MNRTERSENLARLCGNIQQYSLANGLPGASQAPGRARHLSQTAFLANSSSAKTFREICRSGYIASKDFLAVSEDLSINPECAEAILGTTGFTFFYLAPFRFPNTGCGFLFSSSLEQSHRETGSATPFDSGGLHSHLRRQDTSEPARDFLRRHELPVPEHREYLEHTMSSLFTAPEDYLEGREPVAQGPIGLEGGDSRRWTHEVRIPERVLIRTGPLQAVFAPGSLVGKSRAVEDLFKWCDAEGVDVVKYDHPENGDFDELRRTCLEYIQKQLY